MTLRLPQILFALTCLALPGAVEAQGWIEPIPGQPISRVVKLRTDVTVRVDGRVATVEVEELFRNDGRGLGEGEYIYPLPGEAVFSNFSLFQGDQELRGETMNADRARSIYEEIVRRRKDPALIELLGHGAIKARVFPIAAGETRRIILRYTQIMDRAGNALAFRYAGSSAGEGARPVASDTHPRVFDPLPVPISFELVAENGNLFRDPFSPTHVVDVRRQGNRLTVRPSGDIRSRFALFLPFAEDAVGITVATHRPNTSEAGYFMLTLSPPQATNDAVARDVTVVMDVSGSMSGRKMNQARAALHQLLNALGQQDRFRLIAFSNQSRSFRDGWSQAQGESLQDAREWIDRLSADGGTNIADALREAFAAPTHDERLHVVLFMTDGLPSVGEEDPRALARIAGRAGPDARVFAFGVGYDVNTVLLDQLTSENRGATQYVEPDADVEQALSVLAAKISHPVLTDLRVEAAPVEISEVYPVTLPDLFAGEDLIVFGRYTARTQDADGPIRLQGRRSGDVASFDAEVTFPGRQESHAFIPRLWASRKIGHLSRTIRLEGHSEHLVDEIRATALRYGLISEYTSYLVLEPEAQVTADLPAPRMNPAAPAAGASGQAAVQMAEQARRQRTVRNEADLDDAFNSPEPMSAEVRRIGGRFFALRDSVWTDANHQPATRTVVIRPYSSAYFAVLRALPELEPYFELERVVIAGESASVRVSADGVETLTQRAVNRLVQSFRGS